MTAYAATILVVDDEEDLVRLVSYNLERNGYNVIRGYTGKQGLELAQQHKPDLMILDLMMPDMSGIKVCHRLREDEKTKNIPVIMLTARSSEHDRITGFEAGADDYVLKPFSPRELTLRVKALLSRTLKNKELPKEYIEMGALRIFPQDYCVTTETGEALSLTNLEFQLLLALAQSPNRVKTREQLLMTIWQDASEDLNDRAVDTQIKRLRQKMGPHKDMIETIRGVGYRMIPTPNAINSDSHNDTEALVGALI